MKMIKPSFEVLMPQGYDLLDMYKHIEICGRTCYRSTDKIDNDSAEPFVKRMENSKHYAMLEHGTVYLKLTTCHNGFPESRGQYNVSYDDFCDIRTRYDNNHYSRVTGAGIATCYITTNYRVIVENGWQDDLKYMCCATEYHIRRATVRFICNRQVWNEYIRHRAMEREDDDVIWYVDYDMEKEMSFAQESTRYCNYTQEKFGKELTFIEPCWFSDESITDWSKEIFTFKLREAESGYFALIEEGWKPQQAALLLPNDIKTELIITGFVDDAGWLHFFDLRAIGTTGAPHPQAKELAEPLMNEFARLGLIQ